MFGSNQLIYEPDYVSILKGIISEYKSKEEYLNDYDNTFFKNINIIFWTKNIPDSLSNYIKINDKYYVSMNIDEIRKIITKRYDSCGFSNEILTMVAPYLPSKFFEDIDLILKTKNKINLNNLPVQYNPNNRDSVVILDDLGKLDKFIENDKYLFSHELRKICHITARLNISEYDLEKMLSNTHVSDSYSKFLLKNEDGDIVFSNISLNSALNEINKSRQNAIRGLFRVNGDKQVLSKDVLYKVILTKSIEEWSIILDNNESLKNTSFVNVIKNYKNIFKLFI